MDKTPAQTPNDIMENVLTDISNGMGKYDAIVVKLIRALEAAGYRVMSAEVTDEEADAAHNVHEFRRPFENWEITRAWHRAMHSAARKWGGE